MRHRARRPVLDRLHGVVGAHRGAAVVLAVLTATAATGVALTTPGASESARTGSATAGGDVPSYAPDPTGGATGSPSGTDRAGAAGASRTARAPDRGSRGTPRALPTVDATVPTTAAPTPAPSVSPTVPAPQTSAVTRVANASRWVIGVSADSDATFQCSLDGGPWRTCGTSASYQDLDAGTHSFAARATDLEGRTDPTPATLTAEIAARGKG